jgi:type VI secretion system secreted protein VgrG
MGHATYLQAGRPLEVTTPLGANKLLLVGLKGQEALSELFCFQLDVLASRQTEIAFDHLLGQPITATLALGEDRTRPFSGICRAVSQGMQDKVFTSYRLTIVPQFWLLTRKVQCRIFQHLTVPEILCKVLEPLDVCYQIQGTFHPRNYCVQYRESDFAFASRLMEEEGIYYFFKHRPGGHQMVVANTPQSHPAVPEPSAILFDEIDGGYRDDARIHSWEKTQNLCASRYTLWDHCFELPGQNLQAQKSIVDSVPVGRVTHKLKPAASGQLEVFDYPGGYAQRFDGIDRHGNERPVEVQRIFEDSERTVALRMQQEAGASIVIRGAGNCGQLVAGHKFTLQRHFNADGAYVLTRVEHAARLSNYRSGEAAEFSYENHFTCMPLELPFRPARVTPRPTVQGLQTATVVGPPDETIFTDKYGRAKVQFPWDRQGKKDADSSCWLRISSVGAGKGFGFINLPRVGQEVLVAFVEGDPDRPIIVGAVFNAEDMPPQKLPECRTQFGIRGCTIK